MPFVVKTFDRVGLVGCFARLIGRGLYTIGSRAQAKVFPVSKAATDAIDHMQPRLKELGLTCRVAETDDGDAPVTEERYFCDPPA